MAGEELSDREWLLAKMQQSSLSEFERIFLEKFGKLKEEFRFAEMLGMGLEEFRQKFPLKPQRLEEQK